MINKMKSGTFLLMVSFLIVLMFIGVFLSWKVNKSKAALPPRLELLAKDSQSPGISIHIYRYWTAGGFNEFVVAERTLKDGVAITQLK